jgi:hypothetical protein
MLLAMGLSARSSARSLNRAKPELNKVIFIKNSSFHETICSLPASKQIAMRNRFFIGPTLLAGSLVFSQGPADQEPSADALKRQVVANELKTPGAIAVGWISRQRQRPG